VPDLEDIGPKIRPTIGNTAFSVGIGITHEQEGNASVGHFQLAFFITPDLFRGEMKWGNISIKRVLE